jgi:hypothetical protein
MSFVFMMLAAQSASANWFKQACEKWIIADDPFEFEQISLDWIVREVERLSIKDAWAKLDTKEQRRLQYLKSELARRSNQHQFVRDQG